MRAADIYVPTPQTHERVKNFNQAIGTERGQSADRAGGPPERVPHTRVRRDSARFK